MSEITENSIAQVVSSKEIAFIGCCVQVSSVSQDTINGFVAYPLNPNQPSELIQISLPKSDVKFVGTAHINPNPS